MTDIAIVGMGCRFPGGVQNVSQYWKFLLEKNDGVVEVPDDRWNLDLYYDADPEVPGRMYTRKGGFLTHSVWDFDADFFGISPREAAIMDVQQRLMLEVSWEALDDAGVAGKVSGRSVGVYVGGFMNDNHVRRHQAPARESISQHTATSTTLTMLSNRISYVLDLHGPSMTIDTACSSSLVAIHQAVRALSTGECDVAVAGGVNAMLHPESFVVMCKGRLLAADGRSKAFDASADGYGRGEGAGAIVLKPVEHALRDGDRIYAVIRGSGSNQDGRTNGITVPNPHAQADLARQVSADAGIDPCRIGYVEAHGTGTAVGDPIEMAALGAAFGAVEGRNQPLLVGSVKAAIGHLEAAAGVASVIKSALVVHHGTVVPQAWLEKLNPAIPFEEHNLRVATETVPLPTENGEGFVAVNGFGYGGTNAHIILGTAPTASVRAPSRPTVNVLPISAASPEALGELAARLRDSVDENGDRLDEIRDAAWYRRAHHDYRTAIPFRAAGDLDAALQGIVAEGGKGATRTMVPSGTKPVFVFSGMGPQWWRMGRDLLLADGPFTQTARRIDEEFQALAGWSLIEEMMRDETESRVTRTEIAQPANFLVQAGLVAELAELGVRPAAVVGHSVGEVASAYVSGALSLRDALTVSFHRARLQATTAGTGSMLAVGITEAEARHLVFVEEGVDIAAVNGPASVTLAGDTETLVRLRQDLTDIGKFARMLTVEVPYHSKLLDPMLPELDRVLSELSPNQPDMPLYSTVTGSRISDEALGAAYWRRNVRDRVRFADAIRTMIDDGHRLFLEVGPHPVLQGNVREMLIDAKVTGTCVPTLVRNRDDIDSLGLSIARLYDAGALVASTVGTRDRQVGHVDLPAYPWRYQRLWNEAPVLVRGRLGADGTRPLLGAKLDTRTPEWECAVSTATLPWLRDHVVDGLTVLPAAAYLDAALSAAVRPDRETIALADLRFVAPLVVDEHDAPVLRVSVEKATSAILVRSRSLTGGDWTTNATGRVLEAAVEPSFDAADAVRGAHRVPADDLYRQLAEHGLTYGHDFQRIVDAQLGEDGAWATIDAACAEESGHVAHPAVIDSALQCVAALALRRGDLKGAMVPVGVEEVRWFTALPSVVTAVVRLCEGEGLRADIALLGEDERPVMEMVNVEFRPVSPPLEAVVGLDGLFYETVWDSAVIRDQAQAGKNATTRAVVVDLGGVPSERARQVAGCYARSALLHLETTKPAVAPELAQALREAADQPDVSRVAVIAVAGGPSSDDVIEDGIDAVAKLAVVARTVKSVIDAAEEAAESDSGLLSMATRYTEVFRGVVLTERTFTAEPGDLAVLANSSLLGARRSLRNEQPRLQWKLIEASPSASADVLRTELLSGADADDEVRLTPDDRLVPRFRRTLGDHLARLSEPVPVTDAEQNFALEVPKSALFTDLAMRSCERVAPQRGEVELRLDAIGVNYKDAMKALGVLGDKELGETYFKTSVGMEGAAVVTRVGPEVSDLAPGDRVLVFHRDMFRRYLTTSVDSGIIMRCPESMRPEHASSLVAMITAQYGLIRSARLEAGETVLIHGAAGGTGLAAVQVAKARGATVIGSAGTPERRRAVLAAGADHVVSSRSLKFVEDVLRITDGRGVEVVFNSTPGEMIQQNLRVVAETGRVVEIGKADIYAGNVISLAPFDRNITFSAIDLDRIQEKRPAVFREVFTEVLRNIEDGTYEPLPVTVYEAPQIADAFDAVARGRHVGRVALDMSSTAYALPSDTEFKVHTNATYLVTGGFGAFGLATARWLTDQGARHLVLVSRRGATTPDAKETLDALRFAGVEIHDAQVDIGQRAAAAALVHETVATMPPLRGIFHTAGVSEDEPLDRLTRDSLTRVIQPKARGAWNLHLALEEEGVDVDAFVLYSSISSVSGEVPQIAYASANTMLNVISTVRRAQGKRALAVNWGSLNGGMAVASEETERYLAFLGYRPVDMEGAALMLQRCLGFGSVLSEVAIVDTDWKQWTSAHQAAANTTRFAELIAVENSESSVSSRQLAALPETERGEVLEQAMAEQLATVLGVEPDAIDGTRSLLDLGIDSLMVVEFSARVRAAHGIEIPTMEANRGVSLSELAQRMAARITSDDEAV
ncbi:SDR family NAD(P)-dependent oxidoreductase [Streptomyces sp. NPDC047072]|uniref:type I polyketide synthase n=1 Tax=Streptomyces sp. NPDC047072 TaxID=3154809 RepID=UPI0033D8473C